MPISVLGPKTRIDTYVMLDEGSTITLVDFTLIQSAGIQGPQIKIALRGVAPSEVIFNNCQKVIINVESEFGQFKIDHAIAVRGLNLPSQSITQEISNYAKNFEGVTLKPYKDARPKILLGQDNWRLMITREFYEIKGSSFVISRSLLGWAIHGYEGLEYVNNAMCSKHREITSPSFIEKDNWENERLDELIQRYFLIENMGISDNSREKGLHTRALKILNNTTRLVDTYWETGLLWKNENIATIDSRKTAQERLLSVEKKLDRDPEYAALYYAEVERFIKDGYAAKINENCVRERVWYLPHFGVQNPNKPGRVRLVFDAAAKTNGVSLNDQLDTGPDLLQPLPGVLMRFRQYTAAVKSDIKDMFLRVKVIEADRGAQRFLWRGRKRDTDSEIYEMSSLIFGSKSSLCSAIFVKNENASRFLESKPEAAKSIIADTYMDDFLSSRKTVREIQELARDVAFINAKANLHMHGWASNITSAIPTTLTESDENKRAKTKLCEGQDERVLGLFWDRESDELGFNLGLKKIPKGIIEGIQKPTKREFLRIIMSVFDPLGFLSPFILRAKILMQDIWRSGIDWDSPLQDEQFRGWLSWLKNLKKIEECRVPRCCTPLANQGANAQLHVFCDASLKAYASVVYLRFETQNEPAHISLIMAKARVAAVKPLSVPRLELQAALLAARLAKTAEKEIQINITERFFWSDSTTVLQWIRSEPRTRQVYVANRLGEIGESTKISEWRWVPTKLNAADDATRWSDNALNKNDRWFLGPSFLREDEKFWPKEKPLSKKDRDEIESMEIRKSVVCVTSVIAIKVPITARLLGWDGLLVIARRIRTIFDRWRGKVRAEISIESIKSAEEFWFRKIQNDCFSGELEALKNRKEIHRGSKIVSLKPFLDDCGILRANGRVSKLKETEFENRPIILDGNHFATKFLITAYHRRFFHASPNTVVNELKQRFYIVSLRTKLRSITSRCVICRLRRGKPQNPPMSSLPHGRVAYRQRPFSHCGIDYFGPMNVKIGRRIEKRWGVLFTCLTVRAIHLELAHTLSASSAIMALQRMAARRGVPIEIYSDNGTNFTKASKELQEAIFNIEKFKLEQYAISQKIKWNFNPPDAPHMGGAWERLIKSVKSTLTDILRDKTPNEEVLFTVLLEIEHSVNSRPLTHVSVDPRDEEALTPNHFLIGESSGNVKLDRYEAEKTNPRKEFRLAQLLADKFWSRWLKEYLPTLIPRKKWTTNEPGLKIDDIVLIMDFQAPRNS